jgi:hypothetical protein
LRARTLQPRRSEDLWAQVGKSGRVERWRGGLDFGILCVRVSPFVSQYPHVMLRFHLPLIEPDRQISSIRLSDKDYDFAHE